MTTCYALTISSSSHMRTQCLLKWESTKKIIASSNRSSQHLKCLTLSQKPLPLPLLALLPLLLPLRLPRVRPLVSYFLRLKTISALTLILFVYVLAASRARQSSSPVQNPEQYLVNPQNPYFVKTLSKKIDVLVIITSAFLVYVCCLWT